MAKNKVDSDQYLTVNVLKLAETNPKLFPDLEMNPFENPSTEMDNATLMELIRILNTSRQSVEYSNMRLSMACNLRNITLEDLYVIINENNGDTLKKKFSELEMVYQMKINNLA